MQGQRSTNPFALPIYSRNRVRTGSSSLRTLCTCAVQSWFSNAPTMKCYPRRPMTLQPSPIHRLHARDWRCDWHWRQLLLCITGSPVTYRHELQTIKMLFPLVLVITSSALAYWQAKRRLSRKSLSKAVGMLVDCIGTCVVFLAFNLVVGVLAILLIRGLTSAFVSVYALDSVVLTVLSVGQGLLFCFWLRAD